MVGLVTSKVLVQIVKFNTWSSALRTSSCLSTKERKKKWDWSTCPAKVPEGQVGAVQGPSFSTCLGLGYEKDKAEGGSVSGKEPIGPGVMFSAQKVRVSGLTLHSSFPLLSSPLTPLLILCLWVCPACSHHPTSNPNPRPSEQPSSPFSWNYRTMSSVRT